MRGGGGEDWRSACSPHTTLPPPYLSQCHGLIYVRHFSGLESDSGTHPSIYFFFRPGGDQAVLKPRPPRRLSSTTHAARCQRWRGEDSVETHTHTHTHTCTLDTDRFSTHTLTGDVFSRDSPDVLSQYICVRSAPLPLMESWKLGTPPWLLWPGPLW